MPNQEVATKDLVKTPNTQGGHVPNIPVPDGALISEDNNSFILLDTESEGDFGLNHQSVVNLLTLYLVRSHNWHMVVVVIS